MGKEKEVDNAELEWIRFRQETLGAHAFEDHEQSKFSKRMKENPFVPIGAAATVAALGFGLYQFKVGNVRKSQMMMRTRIAAQGFTIIAILGGILLGASSTSRK